MDIFTLVDEKKKIIDSCKLFDKQNIDQIKKFFKIELTWSSKLEYSHVNDIDFVTFMAERVLQTEEAVM